MSQLRQNGTVVQQVRMFKDFPVEISEVNIGNQTSTSSNYKEMSFSALWLYLPGGVPPYVYLDQGAPIGKADSYGPNCVALEAVHRNHPLRLILDGDHDWLPRRVESIDGEDISLHEVTSFTRDNNRWFPSEGHFSVPTYTPKGPVRKLFAVTQIKINRELDETMFHLPRLPIGVRIGNNITGQVSFEGGEPAYLDRQARYQAKEKAATPGNAISRPTQPIHAERLPSGWPWSEFIIGLSFGLILIAAGLWWRGR